jgi:hypothetical protein
MTSVGKGWRALAWLLALAGAALCAWLGLSLARTQDDNRLLTERQTLLVQQIVVLKRDLGAAVARADAGYSPAVARVADAPPPKPGNSREWMEWRQRFNMFRHRTAIRMTWASFHEAIAKMGLSPEKQAALYNLLAARSEAPMDANDAAQAQGITDSHEIEAAVRQAKDSVTSEITDLIGQDGLDALNAAQELKGSQDFINRNVGTDMQMSGIPLTADQQAALAQAFQDTLKQFPNTPSEPFGPGQPTDSSDHVVERDAMLLDKAAGILTPDQMGIFKGYLAENDQRLKIMGERPR